MRRSRWIAVVASVALMPTTLWAGLVDDSKAACRQVRDGISSAAHLSWVGDTDKASAIQSSYNALEFHAAWLAGALDSGNNVEETRSLHAGFDSAASDFLADARTLRVKFPKDKLRHYLLLSRTCSAVY